MYGIVYSIGPASHDTRTTIDSLRESCIEFKLSVTDSVFFIVYLAERGVVTTVAVQRHLVEKSTMLQKGL